MLAPWLGSDSCSIAHSEGLTGNSDVNAISVRVADNPRTGLLAITAGFGGINLTAQVILWFGG
jgi:hypothetical protein